MISSTFFQHLLLPAVALTTVTCLLPSSSSRAAATGRSPEGLWNLQAQAPRARNGAASALKFSNSQSFTADLSQVRALLAKAPPERSSLALGAAQRGNPICEISVPTPRDGKFARFQVEQIEMMEAPLAAKYPEIKTYRGQGLDDAAATIAIDVSPAGFHAFVRSPAGSFLVDPLYRGQDDVYASYYKADALIDKKASWFCETQSNDRDTRTLAHQTRGVLRSGPTLRTYRLACAANHQYVATTGGTVASGLAEVVRIINRVNAVYESELAIRMVLVANNDLIIYPSAVGDPYGNGTGALGQNTPNLNTVIGAANYDIGHVFTTGSGGVAQLGCVCNSNKGAGTTGLPSPAGDAFSIDFVAHEMGHQFGGNHTFNGNTGNCSGGNRSGLHAYEVGSGSSIMAYAGICGATSDLQPHSDAYFAFESFNEIIANTTTGSGNTCPVQTATGNTAPIVNAGSNYTIPRLTPFVLTGSATDGENDILTYCWEERDLGAAQAGTAADNGAAPIFRSFEPSYSSSRTFPKTSDLLNNTTTIGEQLPNLARAAMNFRLTARDNRAGGGGVNTADITLTVDANGPFKVTVPDTAITATNGTSLPVTWDVANTNLPPVSTANVNILLSVDGGYTYPITLAAATANDGSESVTLPAGVTTSQARVKVAAVGNIYFDISNANFTIN